MKLHRRSTTLARGSAAALAMLALAAPAALGSDDLRSPDARDAASQEPAITQSLVSPDARDAATRQSVVTQSLVSPDTRDFVRGVEPGSVEAPVVAVAAREAASSGFDWASAAIGAAIAAALILLALAGLEATSRIHLRHAR